MELEIIKFSLSLCFELFHHNNWEYFNEQFQCIKGDDFSIGILNRLYILYNIKA